MRKMKRLVALLGAALMVALTPASALAASGGYVPTKGTFYRLNNGQWEQGNTFKASYKKDGRITKYQSITVSGNISTTSYSWKGNFLKKRTHTSSSGSSTFATFKYKNNLRKSYTYTGSSGTTSYAYKWKKKKGTFTVTSNSGANTTSGTIKANGKNQVVSQVYNYRDGSTEKVTRKYYGNGNLKEIKTVYSDGVVNIQKYNKDGYESSISSTWPGGFYKETYKYKMDKKKKCPKEVTYIWSSSEDGSGTSKTVYSSYKKVSRIRNCDASGIVIPLG